MSAFGLEDFCIPGEKSILKSIFSSASSESENESEEEFRCRSGNDDSEEVATGAMVPAASMEGESCDGFRTIDACNGVILSIFENKFLGIAHQLWPAALHLTRYFENNPALLEPNRAGAISVIELGAGIGLCGMTLSALGCRHVILTDLEEAISTLSKNVAINRGKLSERVDVQVLRWGDSSDLESVLSNLASSTPPPLIVASDCVYWECLFHPLFSTISELVVKRGSPVYIAHTKRWKKDEKFFLLCRKHMSVEVVDELVEQVPEPNSSSGRVRRRVSRIYRISHKNFEVL